MILVSIWVLGACGLALMLVFRYTGKRFYGVMGQSLIVCSFAIISVVLIEKRQFLVGVGFGASALGQLLMMIRAGVRRAGSADQ